MSTSAIRRARLAVPHPVIGVVRVIALMVAMAVSACGGGDPQGAPGRTTASPGATTGPDLGGLDVCDLLTAEEVRTAVGGEVASGIGGTASCAWSSPGIPSVILAVVPVPDVPTCAAARREAGQDVKGIGAEAWWDFVLAEQPTGSVVACPERFQVTVSVSGSVKEARLRAIGEQLAAKALERL